MADQHGIHAVFLELRPTQEGLSRIAQQIDEGTLKINQGNVYPMSQVAQAWQELMGKPVSGRQKQSGRIVLQID
ncbi:zinc-binding dehydrogenase [Spirosoma sp. KNUC1025]|uniref:zinc-binding dehydrogenase n=1 Tax=Spirosoma sp. KNUC1025 TaxID=2894082 RepID=UPI00386B4055